MRLTLAAAYAARNLRMPLIVEMMSALRQHLVQRPKHMPNRLQSGRQCPEKRKMFEMKNVEAYELMNLWLAQKQKRDKANRSSHETPHRKSRSTGHLKKVVETFETEVTELIASGQEAMQSLQIENNALRGEVLEKSLEVGINDLMVKQLSEQMQAKESELHDVRSEVESTHSYLAKSRDENAKVIADFFTARGMKVETGWLSHEVNVKKSR